nr:immunoglobulin light chain junction region [Macaca mulatta]
YIQVRQFPPWTF